MTNGIYLLFSSALGLYLQIIFSDNISSLVPGTGLRGKKLLGLKKGKNISRKRLRIVVCSQYFFSEIRNTDFLCKSHSLFPSRLCKFAKRLRAPSQQEVPERCSVVLTRRYSGVYYLCLLYTSPSPRD